MKRMAAWLYVNHGHRLPLSERARHAEAAAPAYRLFVGAAMTLDEQIAWLADEACLAKRDTQLYEAELNRGELDMEVREYAATLLTIENTLRAMRGGVTA